MDITMMQWIELMCTLKRISEALEALATAYAGSCYNPNPDYRDETKGE